LGNCSEHIIILIYKDSPGDTYLSQKVYSRYFVFQTYDLHTKCRLLFNFFPDQENKIA